jgi:hypothetical protein
MRTFCLLALGCLLLASPVWAGDAEPDAAKARLEENWNHYQEAQSRLASLEARYSRGMTSNNLVGPSREQVVSGIAQAKREIASARDAHDELFEAARRSGVPWSELDRYEQLPAPPAARQPAIEANPDDLTVGSQNLDDVEEAYSEDSDELEGDAENVDDVSGYESEDLDDADQAESEDSDDMRATSRDPD